MKMLILSLFIIMAGCSKPKPEIKPSKKACAEKIEQKSKKCKDINCKLKLISKLRKCPEFGD